MEVQKTVSIAQSVPYLDAFPIVAGIPIYSGDGTPDRRKYWRTYICFKVDSAMTATATSALHTFGHLNIAGHWVWRELLFDELSVCVVEALDAITAVEEYCVELEFRSAVECRL